MFSSISFCTLSRAVSVLCPDRCPDDDDDDDDDGEGEGEGEDEDDDRLVWLFAINRSTIPRICSCSELVCAIVDLGIVGLSVMCAQCGHNLFIYLCKT